MWKPVQTPRRFDGLNTRRRLSLHVERGFNGSADVQCRPSVRPVYNWIRVERSLRDLHQSSSAKIITLQAVPGSRLLDAGARATCPCSSHCSSALTLTIHTGYYECPCRSTAANCRLVTRQSTKKYKALYGCLCSKYIKLYFSFRVVGQGQIRPLLSDL